MLFKDNSREIKITLEHMLKLSFDSESIKYKPPLRLPFVFTMDSLKKKIKAMYNNIRDEAFDDDIVEY